MKWILKGICVTAVVAIAILGFGYLTMHLWNWVVPGLTGWHTLDWCHAIGLLILCKILFGGFHKGGRGRCGHGGWRHRRHGEWRKRWEEKMAKMTPEEKEKVMRKMRNCGWDGEKWDKWEEPGAEGDSKI
jgi:hypothetical protein